MKRVYEKPTASDGVRVLVDRLWPRGLSKSAAKVDHWLRDLAPSDALRKWFHSQTENHWAEFQKRYLKELGAPSASAALETLYRLAENESRMTLVYASSREQNNATVLRDLLEGMRKPPTSSGPARAAQAGRSRGRAPRT